MKRKMQIKQKMILAEFIFILSSDRGIVVDVESWSRRLRFVSDTIHSTNPLLKNEVKIKFRCLTPHYE